MKHIDFHRNTIISSVKRRYFYNTRDFKKAEALLKKYLRGEKVSFNKIKLCLESFSQFTRQVFQKTRTIPYGETRTYAWMAREVGVPKGSRAIGQALKKNPLTIIIPCHRVIKTNGEIGGFSKGIVVKKKLLEMENNYVY